MTGYLFVLLHSICLFSYFLSISLPVNKNFTRSNPDTTCLTCAPEWHGCVACAVPAVAQGTRWSSVSYLLEMPGLMSLAVQKHFYFLIWTNGMRSQHKNRFIIVQRNYTIIDTHCTINLYCIYNDTGLCTTNRHKTDQLLRRTLKIRFRSSWRYPPRPPTQRGDACCSFLEQ